MRTNKTMITAAHDGTHSPYHRGCACWRRQARDRVDAIPPLKRATSAEYEPAYQGGWGSNASTAAEAMGVGGTVSDDRPVPAQSLLQGLRQPGRAAGSDLVTAARLPRVLVLLPQGGRGAR